MLIVSRKLFVGRNTTKTYFLYDGNNVIMETDVSGVTAKNTYGGPLLLRTEFEGADETTYEYLYNAHGDVVTLLSNGAVAATYHYDSFGNILEQTGEVSNSILYAGYQYDEETGLYYINARMYDPVTARFLQADTYLGNLNDPLSLNLYTYCLNNPHKYVDPSGHFAITLAVVIGAVVWGLIGAAIEYKIQKDAGGMIDYNRVLFQGVLSAGIALVSGGLANGTMVAAQGTRMAASTFGKMLLTEAALGAAEGVIAETGYQLLDGTKVSDLDVGRIAFGGVQGGISGVGGALVGEGIGAGLKALKNSRMISSAMNKTRALTNRGTDAISGGFRKVAADNRGVLDFDAKVGLGEVVESGTGSLNEEIFTRYLANGKKITDVTDLPGSTGISMSRRLSTEEMTFLTQEYGVEFAQVYKYGDGINGGGGYYKLYSGTVDSVQVPIANDIMLINHTHPGGTAYPSNADKLLMRRYQQFGSLQRSSEIIPIGKSNVRFNVNGLIGD